MMKSVPSRFIVLVTLLLFTTAAFASEITTTAFDSEIPTLDDTLTEGTSIALQSEAPPAEPMAEAVPLMEEVQAMDEMTEQTMDEAAPALVYVSELVIAMAIADREPVGSGTLFTTDTERLYCHTRVTSMEPATITHVWYRDGERVAEIPLQIGAASSWRTWSSKAIFPATPAAWHVEVVTDNGTLLAQTDFTVE